MNDKQEKYASEFVSLTLKTEHEKIEEEVKDYSESIIRMLERLEDLKKRRKHLLKSIQIHDPDYKPPKKMVSIPLAADVRKRIVDFIYNSE